MTKLQSSQTHVCLIEIYQSSIFRPHSGEWRTEQQQKKMKKKKLKNELDLKNSKNDNEWMMKDMGKMMKTEMNCMEI